MDENGGAVTFKGYECKEGKKYAEAEAREPLRILTATVRIHSDLRSMLPVRTDRPIPKKMLGPCMKALANVRLTPPVETGQVVLSDILRTGAKIIATMGLFT